MTIRNIVPRNNNEGQLGTENKKWNKIYTNEIFATNFTGNLTGTADNAIKDNKSQQIDATYIKNISINNDTLTVTKGNDDSQDITINNISHAISSDNAINANKLQELTAGNYKGQIPINNGIENVNLNAALLNGKASSYFATSNHTHATATQSSNGYMSNADKKKLDGIASGAEVNQNAFANVKVGSTTISSDAKQDTLELVAGTNISLVGDANNDKVTIGVTGKVASATTADKVNGIASDGGSLELVRGTMAGSDSFRIKIGGSNDSGYAEIATADNGNDPIYVRQYGSRFTTATRTATILDESGNTSFPGKVTASSGFSGTLNSSNIVSSSDTFGGQLTVKRNSNNATTIKFTNTSNVNRYVGFTSSDKNMYKWGDSGENQTAFLDASNYNNYAPTKTGGGASGTWGINISGNATSATKATNDQNGMNISTGFLNRNRGDIPSKNFDNAYIEGLYNFGNSETNRPCDFGRLLTLNNGYNSTGSWIWQLALPTRNNNLRLRTRTNGEAWLGWRTIPFTDSPAFSGSPTAPTPGTSDNGTRIATTAFVQSLINSLKGSIGGAIVASNLAQNGYVKFSNGLILQWGSGEGNFTFPISFTQTCFSVFLTRNRGGYEYSLIVASKSLTNVTWISRGHGNGGGDALGYILAIGI